MSASELLDCEFGTIAELIAEHAKARPESTALIQDDRQLDYRGLHALMDRVAVALRRDGVQAGEIVAICAASSIEYVAAFLGALRAGVAVAPLAPSSTAQSLVAMAADCGAKLLFLDESVGRALEPLRGSMTAEWIALDTQIERTPSWQGWLAAEGSRPEPVAIDPDAAFNVIYSSGTTGTPKGIVQPHRMRWAHVRRGSDSGYGPDSVTMVSTPLYSNTTLVSLFPSLALGGAVVLEAQRGGVAVDS
jgi:acyl-CoA synthetase (AMP-forming)/AMP-acid ligase II